MPKRRSSEFPYVLGEGKLLPKTGAPRSRFTGPKPIRRSAPIESRKSGSCWVCNSRIEPGALICKAEFRNGTQRWVHSACCADPPS